MPDMNTKLALLSVENATDAVLNKWRKKGGAEGEFAAELLTDICDALARVRVGLDPNETQRSSQSQGETMKKWIVFDPGVGGIADQFDTEAEAIEAATKLIEVYRHEGPTQGEWPTEIDEIMVLEIKHQVTDHTPDADTYDFKLTPAF